MTAFPSTNDNNSLPRWLELRFDRQTIRFYESIDNYNPYFEKDNALGLAVLEIREKLDENPESTEEDYYDMIRMVRNTYSIPEGKADNNKGKVALWDNNKVHIVNASFHLTDVRGEIQNNPDKKSKGYISHLNEIAQHPAVVLFPIDPRMTIKDIHHATSFAPNSTNTGWIFSHTNQNFHRDFEYKITSALDSVFWKEKDLIQDDADSKLYSLLVHGNTSDRRSTWGDSTRRLDDIRRFHSQVELEALKLHKSNHLGYYHQNPTHSHIHEVLTKSLRKVKAKWEADNDVLAAWLSIKDAVNRMISNTSILYQYKTRWDIAAEAEED